MNESSPKKVLVVDDDAGVVILTKRFLAIGGYEATGAADAAEALRLVESESWDLVITDRSMPGMDGEELAERIKYRTPKVPIIVITGFPNSVLHPDRVDAILRKPFQSAELLAQVEQLLRDSG